jgi:hypothetical protein
MAAVAALVVLVTTVMRGRCWPVMIEQQGLTVGWQVVIV